MEGRKEGTNVPQLRLGHSAVLLLVAYLAVVQLRARVCLGECPAWPLDVKTNGTICLENGCPWPIGGNCAEQGLAGDPRSGAFFTSKGSNPKAHWLTKYDANWQYLDAAPVGYDLGIDHMGDIAVTANYIYAPLYGRELFGDDLDFLQVAWFSKATLQHIGHTDLLSLDEQYGIGDGDGGGLSGVAHHNGHLYVVEYQQSGQDNPTPHVFRFDLLPGGGLDVARHSAFEIPTRYANGVEVVDDYLFITHGNTSGDNAGAIDVYLLDEIGAGPVYTWLYDVVDFIAYPQEHAQGLTYVDGSLYVSQVFEVHRLDIESAPGFPRGLIEDCFGNCAPSDWVGNGSCDNGANVWDSASIHFDCDAFDCDGGDCECGSDPDDYTFCCSAMCLEVEPDAPYDCIVATPTVGIDDELIFAWFRLDEACTDIQGARWDWYRPDGSLWDSVASEDTCSVSGCAGPCTWFWYIPIEGTSNADWRGQWQVDMYTDAGNGWEFTATEHFVLHYLFADHATCHDTTGEPNYECVGESSVFLQTDEKVVSWMRLEMVSNPLETRWDFFEPDGSLYLSEMAKSDNPEPEYDYWGFWHQAWSMTVNGAAAADKCGQWRVDGYIKDPFGNWELEYSDIFHVLEDPNIPPTLTVFAVPETPVAGDAIALELAASDNTYLQQVSLHWFDTTWHESSWDDLVQDEFTAMVDIGIFEEHEEIQFYATASDTSGNGTITDTQIIVVGTRCRADIDGDGGVDVDDLIAVILDWGCAGPPGSCVGDVTADGIIDRLDLLAVVSSWGPCG